MNQRLSSIQFLRFIAASMVAISHSVLTLRDHFAGSVSDSLVHITNIGASGVHIFFVISGFIMIYTSFSKSTTQFSASDFLTRRFIRIYPVYWVYALAYLAGYNLFSSGFNLSPHQIFGSFILFPGSAHYIIGPAWTLAFEVYFYVCFSQAMRLGMWRGASILTGFFLLSIASRLFIDASGPAVHVLTNSLLIEFLAGAWIGIAVLSGCRVGRGTAWLCIALGILGLLAGVKLDYERLPSLLTWGIPSMLLVGGMAFREVSHGPHRILDRLSILGDSSYSMYLLHIALNRSLVALMIMLFPSIPLVLQSHKDIGPLAAGILMTTICIFLTWIAYVRIERILTDFLQRAYRRKLTETRVMPSTSTNK